MMGDSSQQTYAQISYGYKKKNTFTLYDVQKKNKSIKHTETKKNSAQLAVFLFFYKKAKIFNEIRSQYTTNILY